MRCPIAALAEWPKIFSAERLNDSIRPFSSTVIRPSATFSITAANRRSRSRSAVADLFRSVTSRPRSIKPRLPSPSTGRRVASTSSPFPSNRISRMGSGSRSSSHSLYPFSASGLYSGARRSSSRVLARSRGVSAPRRRTPPELVKVILPPRTTQTRSGTASARCQPSVPSRNSGSTATAALPRSICSNLITDAFYHLAPAC